MQGTYDELVQINPLFQNIGGADYLKNLLATNNFDFSLNKITTYVQSDNPDSPIQRKNEYDGLLGGKEGYSHDEGSSLYSLKEKQIGNQLYTQISSDQLHGLTNGGRVIYDPELGLLSPVDNIKANKGNFFEREVVPVIFTSIMVAGGVGAFGGGEAIASEALAGEAASSLAPEAAGFADTASAFSGATMTPAYVAETQAGTFAELLSTAKKAISTFNTVKAIAGSKGAQSHATSNAPSINYQPVQYVPIFYGDTTMADTPERIGAVDTPQATTTAAFSKEAQQGLIIAAVAIAAFLIFSKGFK